MWSFIFLGILLVLVVILLIASVSEKAFLNKKNVAFFLPLLAVLLGLYYLGYSYAGNEVNSLSFFDCLTAALKAFKLEVVKSYIEPLANDNIIYKIDIFIAVLLAGLTVVSGVLGFFKVGINNFRKVFFISRRRSVDIVFGDLPTCVEYAKKYKNSVIWVDPRAIKMSIDDRTRLFEQKLPFIYHVFSPWRLKFFSFLSRSNVHIICFQKNNEYLDYVYNLIDNIKTKRSYRFYVQGDGEYLTFLDEQLTKHCQGVANVSACSFDIYELMSRKFSNEYNLASFLPRDFFENGTIKKGHNINVVMLGFGKTSYALFKSIIINNQFVEVDGDKYKTKPINFYLYDKKKESLNRSLISYFLRYEEFTNSKLKPIDLPCVIHKEVLDVKGDYNDAFLERFKPKKNEFTFYFVSTRNDLEDAAIADALSRSLDLKSSVIFYNVDDQKSALKTDNPHLVPVGYKDIALSHDLITNDTLWLLSNLHNDKYHELKKDELNKLSNKPIIEKLSNAYAVINYRFKLNVLGFDYSTDTKGAVLEKQFMKVYDPSNKRKEFKGKYYNEINTRTAIAFQEHLRWSMFYIVNGYRPMDLEEVYYDKKEKKIVHKNPIMKRHACLVDFYELEKLMNYEFNLLPKMVKRHPKNMADVDCYKYDFQSLDGIYESITKLNYTIKKLK